LRGETTLPARGGNPPSFPRPQRSLGRKAPPTDLGRDPGGDSMIGEEVMVPSSEADQLRQQLLQAQRLSSVGALASSVAHEFNNILTAIINYAKLALRPQSNDADRVQALEKILKSGHRAAQVIKSMLGY